jgi:hypothetical protein
LAELKRRGVLLIGPGTSWAIGPVRLVHLVATASLFYDRFLTTDGICNCFQGNTLNIVFAHYALDGRGNISPRDDSIEQLR